MIRKNNTAIDNEVSAAEKLADDEVITISDTRTIKKGRIAKPEPEPEPELLDIDLDDDDEDDDSAGFDEGSIGELLTQSEDEQMRNTQCNIFVVRKPDSPGEKFAKPCVSRMSEAPIRNIDLNQPRSEIEELVRTHYLGGHYYLQIQIGNRMHGGWSCDLADPPDATARMRGDVAPTMPVYHQPDQPAKDPVDSFLDSLEKQKRMKDLMFGDVEAKYEKEIAELRAENERARLQPNEPKSERLTMLETALSASRPDLQNRLLDHLFPSDEPDKRHWIADTLEVVFQNKDTIVGLLGSLFPGVVPQPQPAAVPDIADILRQPAPDTPNDPLLGGFKRRDPNALPESEHEPEIETLGGLPVQPWTPTFEEPPEVFAETETPNSEPDELSELDSGDETAIDAEITEETKTEEPASEPKKRTKRTGV